MDNIHLKQRFFDLFRVFDAPLLIASVLLMAIGIVTVYSASYNYGVNQAPSQFLNFGFAFLVMWLFASLSPQVLMRYAVPVYLTGVVLLVLVLLMGTVVNGSRRWISIGITRIQPSEITKLAVPLILAWYYQKVESIPNLLQYIVGFVLILIPFALIAKQPDLGTAILIGSAGFYVIFFAGLPWKIIISLSCSVAVLSPIVWSHLHSYQQKRILTLFDPTTDAQGAGYHIIQSTIAIGSGGFFGKGYLSGTQTHLEFIPERHTDFIFAVLTEEWGFIGAVAILLVYTFIIARGTQIAASAQLLFSKLLAGSITFSFFTYVFVNIGMVSGVLPVVGVPLPFISYGGTSLVIMFMSIGILMSIHKHRLLMR